MFQAEEYGRAEEVFGALSLIDYPNAKEKADEARNALMKAEAKKEEIYQKAVALEEAEDYEQAISIYEGLGDYKDCAERIMACNEKNEKKTKYQTAVQKEEDGDYSGAFQAYEELGDYKDSIARGSFCVKKYQALNRVAKIALEFKFNSEHWEYVYSYDEQGFLQSLEKKGTRVYTESYTLDSDGFILAGKSEGQWTNEKGCTVVSDYVYNEYGDEVFSKSTYRSPNNRVYQDGASFIDFHEYTYDEYENILKETIGQTDERTYEYIYDDYGRVKTKTQYQNYKVLNKTEYSYGENGLLRQTRCFNSSNELTQTDTYTYVYYGTERVRTEEGLAEHRERMNQLIEEAQKEPEKTYTTLKPGSNSQEVLDARMKLYELGYFKKKPTQTEYTDSMADYVKKFEKDHGLTQDGVLSPEDQEVLFGL